MTAERLLLVTFADPEVAAWWDSLPLRDALAVLLELGDDAPALAVATVARID